MKLMLSAALIAATICPTTSALAEPPTIQHRLRREPAYAVKPEYCLLLFGPEEKFAVWLVTAGEAFFADTNGDGDLTQPKKRIYSEGNSRVLSFVDASGNFMRLPVPENERVYLVGDVFDPSTRTWYNVTVRRSGRLKTATFEIFVNVQQQLRLMGKLPRFGERPTDAPVLHFDGPLKLGLVTTQLIRGRPGNDIEAWIGTDVPSGAKGQPTYVVHDDGVPRYVFPVARIDFFGNDPHGRSISTSVSLNQREDQTLFRGWLKVPEDAGLTTAKMRLTVSNGNWRIIRPGVFEVPFAEPRERR
jgi:hypothetical protein